MNYEKYFSLKRTVLAVLIIGGKRAWLISVAALFIFLIFFFTPFADAEEGEMCFDGEPTVVKIIGEFYEKTFPGPPEYESIEKGDRPETQWILKLDNPICVNRPLQEKFWEKRVIRDVKKVQLVLSQSMYKKYRRLMQKKVVVTGTLWDAHTGHHRTRILITVKEIYPKKETPAP